MTIDLPRWLAARLGLHAYIDKCVKTAIEAALWEPIRTAQDDDDLPALFASAKANNRAFAERNSGFVPSIHTQHALPAIHRSGARRVIPARLWVEKRTRSRPTAPRPPE